MSRTFRQLLFIKLCLCFSLIFVVHCKTKRRGYLNKEDAVSDAVLTSFYTHMATKVKVTDMENAQYQKRIDLLKDFTFSTIEHETENLNTKGTIFTASDKITNVNLKKIMRNHGGEITAEFIGYSNRSSTTLLGIYLKHKPLPLFELSLDINHRKVIVRYQGERSFQRLSLKFGKIIDDWMVLSAEISRTQFTVTVGCWEQRSVSLRQPMKQIPKRVFAVLASGKGGENGFTGELLEARLYPQVMDKAALLCSKPVNLVNNDGYVNDISADIHLSGAITPNGDRILLLEQQITQLNKMVNTLKQQNKNLTSRVAYLESCDCYTECTHEGEIFDEGQTWNRDECTVCICKSEKADCLRRTDIPSCQAPCSYNPCLNSGRCVAFNESQYDVACMCQPPYDGPTCEFKENPCVWQAEPGICDQWIERFYYDRFAQECLPFNYTGCGGNLNNYESLDECEAVAVTGSCCYREYSLKVEDVIVAQQHEQFGCKDITLSECQATHRQVNGDKEMEVISFYPGVTCGDAGCGQGQSQCSIDGKVYGVGEKVVLGCQACSCESSGQFVCSCSKKAVRKEIRDMTQAELSQFQAAIQQLRLVGPGNPWEEFRDIYMRHTMHSNGGPYFLPWHRVFLRRLEQKLQSIDCSITLPYFDFTTDIGNFADALIWQPNYFGGDGIEGCVPDHPFGLPGSWRPCIMRQFNPDVKLPTLIELAMAIASDDYTDMSMALESYVSYVHTYIGGDMATRAASYDPIFYSIHAYVDMLYWWWQQKGDNKFTYPAAFANIPMVPFNIPPSAVLDLEADLCVAYSPPSKGHPCNVSEGDKTPGGEGPMRGDITPEGEDAGFADGFNSLGYNTDGYDRRGFDVFGYRDSGFTRDGYSRQGYDKDGYDRYGYDVDGYSRYGYDKEGLDRDGVQDISERYDAYGYDKNCLNRNGLDADGYDRYGYSPEGYNREGCNFYFTGPFSTGQVMRVWGVLRVQTREFLMSLSRSCPGVATLPSSWFQQYWITNMKDVTGMLPVDPTLNSQSHNSAQFCFDIDPFLTSCGCDAGIATCTDNPCKSMACPSYPEASCHIDFCGVCKPRWYVDGEMVDCFEERDFCVPNRCENGGECVQSIWPGEPQLTLCICLPGYDGQYCQYMALDVCELPVSTGQCVLNQETRFYFNYETQECQSFVYSGCGGNANNFVSRDACQSRCKYGACCYRFPRSSESVIGYDEHGYDRYGFDISGNNRNGIGRTEGNGIKTGGDRFLTRYDWQGYDKNGYNFEGYDRQGLDKSGFDVEGFNLTGYSRQGEYDGIIDYDVNGFDAEGYNRAGFTCYGTDRDGLDVYRVYADYVYRCRSLTLQQCQRRETQPGNQVVKFARGKRCDDVKCEENCGCLYNSRTYRHGESFQIGCQYCTCTLTGSVECTCTEIYRRKEVRDMTQQEMETYQDAVKQLSKMEHPSAWFQFAQMFAEYKPQAVGNSGSLPWHRYFLRMVERELQQIDCSITIPYYDWTLNAGDQLRSRIWAANKFGGNGEGVTGCVEYHPFKDYYPPYWAPCLRRQFNRNIQLPDAVDFQYALNEDSYDKFRLSMEVYLNIFKTWVGGHMASDYAPYDPLYLSVAAFIDRVWWDWENKQVARFLAYPQHLRYIPMAPFRSTPDDVMDSKKQMCVTYFPLTEGVACNMSLPNYNMFAGYDRHGFDTEGYDRDGYDMYGMDRDGKPDTRGVYNSNGFDRHGYRRNGYDSSGFDRYGFSADNYNIDGYDPEGYDISGYNRYGFNRNGVTDFGFHKNGTSISPTDSFDRYGYNRYGRDRYGLDHQGYDVYGFDTMGYDRTRCNRYYLGPMLVIIKRWAEIQLNKADDKTMRIITRICPAVSPLPEWRYTVNWLQRGDQLPLIEGILGRAQQRARDQDTQTSSISSSGDTVGPWGPDRSLCFVSYYYAECPFGKFPVSCEDDLCAGRTCPGYPDAVCRVNRCGECTYEWYHGHTGDTLQCGGCIDRDGRERGEQEAWPVSVCETCTCQEGLVSCSETQCFPPDCGHPSVMLGQCCPSCDGCLYEGRLYTDGRRFTPASVACDVCECGAGTVRCEPVPCPDIGPCQTEVTLDGECCPSCIDCGRHVNGTVWKETPCQRCRCLSGQVDCERIRCFPPDCSHPVTPPGECCPGCDGCLYEGRLYTDGRRFTPASVACDVCECGAGTVRCEPVPCPDIGPCQTEVTLDGECCPSCIDCGLHVNGTVWKETPCQRCRCLSGQVDCERIRCFPPDCSHPVTPPGECCPGCDGCLADDRTFYNGETYFPDDCNMCTCRDGNFRCDPTPCPEARCRNPITLPGECCPVCDNECIYEGRAFQHSMTFLSPRDQCRNCSCDNSAVQCVPVTCSRMNLPCRSPITDPGQCCPTRCPSCTVDGRQYANGATWKSADNPCETCVCEEGFASCERRERCPMECDHGTRAPGQCCSPCTDCVFSGLRVRDGQTLVQPGDNCQQCTCRAGQVTCESLRPCPTLSCRVTETPPGACCPQCKQCIYEGRAFQHGMTFLSPRDRCMNCSCDNSAVQCVPVTCSRMNLPCRSPITDPGQCCPTRCPTCTVDGRQYANGATWKSADNPCETCVCEEGFTSCQRRERCPLECDHGTRAPGQCCSPCTDCVFSGLRVRDGQTLVQPGDNCRQCTCRAGQVTCESLRPCPTLPCRVTETPPGACCPQCKRCEYQRRVFSEGDVVSSDRCSTCYCREGEVVCERVSCPPLRCSRPRDVPGECCPICDDCDYKGRRYEDEQRFTPVREPCLDCLCQAGEVRCHDQKTECPGRQCTHPIESTRQCCPKCDGCSYLGRRFRNRQKFVPPGDDKCKICRCVDGSVTCMDMGCGPIQCDNAVRVPGQCCAVCPMGCSVMGIEYRDGQTFIDFMDRCNVCTCMMGEIRCTEMMTCPPVTCTHPANRPGNCCPSCTMCELGSQTYMNRERFTHPHDPCQQCLCEDGSIKCNSLTRDCPQTRCVDAVLDPSSCCPVCPVETCVYAGRQYREGQAVPASRDRCEVCRCLAGDVECAREACPSTSCRHPAQDGCCQTCDACSYSSRRYEQGEMFASLFDQCEDCVCQGGTVNCLRRLCATPGCRHPVYPPGGCCPECSGCTFQGLVYESGERFSNPADPCLSCICSSGNVRCDNICRTSPCEGVDCATVTCSHPVQGECCPECTHCQLGGTRVSHGQSHPARDDSCSTCICRYGSIICEKPACRPASCSHPTMDPCGCPVCGDDCVYDGHLVQNGQRFDDPLDACSDCLCRCEILEHPIDLSVCDPVKLHFVSQGASKTTYSVVAQGFPCRHMSAVDYPVLPGIGKC